jgi:DNA mismatch repair protein MutS2
MTADNTLEQLEFSKLLSAIALHTKSDASRRFVTAIQPLKNRNEIEERFSLVGELMRLSENNDRPVLSEFPDVKNHIEAVRPEGAVLDPAELAGFMPVLDNCFSVLEQFGERDDIPSLKHLTHYLTGHPEIYDRLARSLDDEGNILDSASILLADLRRQVRGLENRIRRKLEEMTRDESVAKFLQDDFITKRAGRWVIPVRMDSKGQVDGVVHDVSKSGETAFVEPLAIISLVNKLENLVAEQKAEEIRIVREICSMIRVSADSIIEEFRIIVYLDALLAIAQYAEDLDMGIPGLNDNGYIDIRDGRHPLLASSLGRPGKESPIVPLNAALGEDTTVMVITGPNAGGKTVAIKTIGMLAQMAMCGIPVSADPASNIPVVTKILIDMGDEQSIEQNLSTFSAHVANISHILGNAGPASLVLIDELGTGTDPEEGSAIACAVLSDIMSKKALVFATTHLMGIKGFVQRTEGMVNASMEFDQDTFSPLYRLRVGEPGQSHAIEIARKFGLPEHVLELSKELLGSANVAFDALIADLNNKRSAYEEELHKIRKKQDELQVMEETLKEKLRDTEKRRKDIFAAAYAEAGEIVSGIKREMYDALDEMREKDRAGLKRAIKEAGGKQDEITEKMREYRTDDSESKQPEEIKVGDMVYVTSLGYDAAVVETGHKQDRIKVRAGHVEVEVPTTDIRQRKGVSLEITPRDDSFERSEGPVSSRLNLVGARADEALSRIEPFLNHALLGGLREVVIVHGLGEGILLKVVREYLEDHPLVKSFRPGELSEGGNGVTIVRLQ